MATLAIQEIVRSGLEPAYAAAAGGGDEFINDGKRTYFHLKNGSGGAIVATFATPKTVAGLAVADLAVSIPAGEERVVGPFPADTFNDGDGKVQVTYDGVTSLTVGAFKI